jgi:hypothetical protein
VANIVFNSITLQSPVPAPGNRFLSWRPKANPIGPRHAALGSGQPYKVKLRDEQQASFIITNLRPSDLDTVLQFQDWAEQGGVFTVNTQDASSRSYTCYLAPETTVEIQGPDQDYEYSMSLTVINSAQTGRMLCVY